MPSLVATAQVKLKEDKYPEAGKAEMTLSVLVEVAIKGLLPPQAGIRNVNDCLLV